MRQAYPIACCLATIFGTISPKIRMMTVTMMLVTVVAVPSPIVPLAAHETASMVAKAEIMLLTKLFPIKSDDIVMS